MIALPQSGIFLGLDWSGSAKPGKKIWAAQLSFEGTKKGKLIKLYQPFSEKHTPPQIAEEFADWLQTQSFEVAGFDFCFSLPRGHPVKGIPKNPRRLGKWIRRFQTPEEFKSALGRERKRATDRHLGTPFAPTNLRIFRQTYWGLRALADICNPILPWDKPGPRAIVEVFPNHTAAFLTGTIPYKGTRFMHEEARRDLLREIQYKARIQITKGDEERMIADSQGDAIDAVLAAIAAAHAKATRFAGVPETIVKSGEGWIYTIRDGKN